MRNLLTNSNDIGIHVKFRIIYYVFYELNIISYHKINQSQVWILFPQALSHW